MEPQTRIYIMGGLTLAFFILELATGLATQSMALIADSFHMMSDMASLAIGLVAMKLAARKGLNPPNLTYGYGRAETLGAFTNGVILIALGFATMLQAVERFVDPVEVGTPIAILAVGCCGLLMNVFGMFLFSDGAGSDGDAHSERTVGDDDDSSHNHGRGEQGLEEAHKQFYNHPHGPRDLEQGLGFKDVEEGRGRAKVDEHHGGYAADGRRRVMEKELEDDDGYGRTYAYVQETASEENTHGRAESAHVRRASEPEPRVGGRDEAHAPGLRRNEVHAHAHSHGLRDNGHGRARAARPRTQGYQPRPIPPTNPRSGKPLPLPLPAVPSGTDRAPNLHRPGPPPALLSSRFPSLSTLRETDSPDETSFASSSAFVLAMETLIRPPLPRSTPVDIHGSADDAAMKTASSSPTSPDPPRLYWRRTRPPGHGGHGGMSGAKMNLRALFLDAIGDAAGNLCVIASSLCSLLTSAPWRVYADPVVSVIIACIIASTAVALVRSAGSVLLQGVTRGVDVARVRWELRKLTGVVGVEELCVWGLSGADAIGSVRVSVGNGVVTAVDVTEVAADVRRVLKSFGIGRATVEVELVSRRMVDGRADEETLAGGSDGDSTPKGSGYNVPARILPPNINTDINWKVASTSSSDDTPRQDRDPMTEVLMMRNAKGRSSRQQHPSILAYKFEQPDTAAASPRR
ncbi:hypothetical protein HK101_009998 [Irineochytrium annulatum]|nr:hypothetical protein HK101_009998 [Irineochytrium annulatum]